jgi:hypothetical protein
MEAVAAIGSSTSSGRSDQSVSEREEARFNHCAVLAVFHLMLVHATIVRYVDDGLAGVWASLPM